MNIQTTPQRLEEIIDELKEIQERILSCKDEAMSLLKEAKGRRHVDYDRRTWFANIELAVINDTQWLGKNSHTLQDAINALRNHDDDEAQS